MDGSTLTIGAVLISSIQDMGINMPNAVVLNAAALWQKIEMLNMTPSMAICLGNMQKSMNDAFLDIRTPTLPKRAPRRCKVSRRRKRVERIQET